MNETNNPISIRLKTLTFNTFYNLLGYSIPLVFAFFLIPVIIQKLGTERFGILTIAWVVLGYFGFFDLGLGRALTKIISEKLSLSDKSEIPDYFWATFHFTFLFSTSIVLILFLLKEQIVFTLFTIPFELNNEALRTFEILLIAIPFISTSAGFRGFLESYQRFDIINILRIFIGIFSFLIPVIVSFFTLNLFWIVFFLTISRILIWSVYLIIIFKLNKDVKTKISFKLKLFKPIFKLSSWMTVSNLTVPIIVYLDRIMIASLVSSTAVAYYATPYEVITKLLIVPSALTAVLFPTFAANYLRDYKGTILLSNKAMKYIFLLLFPIVFTIVFFSFEFLYLWVGPEFANKSNSILQLLAVGILFNSVAYIPFSFIEGIGRPDITAKIQLFELPFYVFLMWLSIKNYGTLGAAFIYAIRMIIDCLLMIYFSRRISGKTFSIRMNPFFAFFLIITVVLTIVLLNQIIFVKILFLTIVIFLFLYVSWKFILDLEDRKLLQSKLLPFLTK